MNFFEQNENKLYFAVIAFCILAAAFLSTSLALYKGVPGGSDFWYHYSFAQKYANGELALFDSKLMENNGGPYPPLFHLVLAFFVKLGVGIEFAALLQALLYPLALSLTAWLVWKFKGPKAAALVAVLILSSVAFFDRNGQVTPQAFDAIFMPIAAYAFFKGKELLFLASTAIMVYSHAPYSLLLLAAFVVYSLLFSFNKKTVFKAIAISIPMVLTILFFLPSMLSAAGNANTMQEEIIAAKPLFFFLYYSAAAFLVLIASFFAFASEKQSALSLQEKSVAARLQVFSLVWVFCLLPLVLFFSDRFASYVLQPTAVFASLALCGRVERKWFLALLIAVLLFALYYNVFAFYGLLQSGGFYVQAPTG
jgi:hypothetical protein